MSKRQHTSIVRQLTDSIIAEHVKSGAPDRLYDLEVPGLSLRGPNKVGHHVWWYQSADRETPALGALHRLGLADARRKASTFGPPSAKAVRIVAGSESMPVASAPAYDPEARRLDTMKALVDEIVDARLAAMKPKLRDYIQAEIAKGIERELRERG